MVGQLNHSVHKFIITIVNFLLIPVLRLALLILARKEL